MTPSTISERYPTFLISPASNRLQGNTEVPGTTRAGTAVLSEKNDIILLLLNMPRTHPLPG